MKTMITTTGLAATALALALAAPAVATTPDATSCPASRHQDAAIVEIVLPALEVAVPRVEAIAREHLGRLGELRSELREAEREISRELHREVREALRHGGVDVEPADGFGLADALVLAAKVPVRIMIAVGTALATVVGSLIDLA